MKLSFKSGNPTDQTCDALIISAFVSGSALDSSGLVAEADSALGGELLKLAADARFTGKRGSTLTVATLGRMKARRVVLAGVGSADKLSHESIRRAWGAATAAARDSGAMEIISALPPSGNGVEADRALASAAEASTLTNYRFTAHYGTGRKNDPAPRDPDTLTFVGDLKNGADAISRGGAIAAAICLTRDVANEPASVINPVTMAEQARQVAKEHRLEIKVYGAKELEQMGAGGIVNVGKGSAVEPQLIHMTYRPKSGSGDRQIGLIGKCITFDTGGYSIKPYEGMLEMKGDMAGGAAVLGAMAGLNAINCPNVVHGVICAAENMISGQAFRPGDILTGMNGVTMEILSTDAEGRLVLADGLVYTARQGATELIDLATLTGAIVVALGDGTAGLFCNNDKLANGLLGAAEEAGERIWRMPLTEELNDQIKGDVGDIKNTGGRAGGAITAALFIQHFCEGLPWAHLDIAGCNRTSKAWAYTPKGATGWGVRTLLEYVSQA